MNTRIVNFQQRLEALEYVLSFSNKIYIPIEVGYLAICTYIKFLKRFTIDNHNWKKYVQMCVLTSYNTDRESKLRILNVDPFIKWKTNDIVIIEKQILSSISPNTTDCVLHHIKKAVHSNEYYNPYDKVYVALLILFDDRYLYTNSSEMFKIITEFSQIFSLKRTKINQFISNNDNFSHLYKLCVTDSSTFQIRDILCNQYRKLYFPEINQSHLRIKSYNISISDSK